MNGRVAKKIRKFIYGETSLRIKRGYVFGNTDCKWAKDKFGTIVNTPVSPRARYQARKNMYYGNR